MVLPLKGSWQNHRHHLLPRFCRARTMRDVICLLLQDTLQRCRCLLSVIPWLHRSRIAMLAGLPISSRICLISIEHYLWDPGNMHLCTHAHTDPLHRHHPLPRASLCTALCTSVFMWALNLNVDWLYICSRNDFIFSLGNGCTQFFIQHTLLDTKLMDSLLRSSLYFTRPCQGGFWMTLVYGLVDFDDSGFARASCN